MGVLAWAGLTACVDTPSKGGGQGRQGNAEFLTYWTDMQIIPSIEGFRNSVSELYTQTRQLDEASLSTLDSRLEAVKSSYQKSFLALQDFLIFDRYIFSSNRYNLTELVASFPVNTAQLNDEIDGGYTLDQIISRMERSEISSFAVGFPALDYILYSGLVDIQEPKVRKYLRAVTHVMDKLAEEALQYYQTDRETFIAEAHFGTSGSFSILLNTLMRNYEKHLRTHKVGYPVGAYGFGGHNPVPNAAEAYYTAGNFSSLLLKRSIEALDRLYRGIPLSPTEQSNTIYSLQSFFNIYINAPKNLEINNKVQTSLQAIQTAVDGIQTDNIANWATNDIATLKGVYDALQQLVGILKTDAFTALNITVTYLDGEEGD